MSVNFKKAAARLAAVIIGLTLTLSAGSCASDNGGAPEETAAGMEPASADNGTPAETTSADTGSTAEKAYISASAGEYGLMAAGMPVSSDDKKIYFFEIAGLDTEKMMKTAADSYFTEIFFGADEYDPYKCDYRLTAMTGVSDEGKLMSSYSLFDKDEKLIETLLGATRRPEALDISLLNFIFSAGDDNPEKLCGYDKVSVSCFAVRKNNGNMSFVYFYPDGSVADKMVLTDIDANIIDFSRDIFIPTSDVSKTSVYKLVEEWKDQ